MESKSSATTAKKAGKLARAAVFFVWAFAVATAGALVYGYTAALPNAVAAARESACRGLAPEKANAPDASEMAPDLELVDRQGQIRKLSDYRGRFVVLNFWATWCEPCLREWPELDKLAARIEGRDDIVVLAVSVDKDRAEVEAFVERLGLGATKVEILHDPSEKAHERFGSEKLPDTYFVDAAGKIRYVFVNARLWGRPQAQFCVEQQASLE
jgi:peroxiredoxin